MNKRITIIITYLIFILIIQFQGKLLAQQTGMINTDRPDITESAVVVPTGCYQLESGTLFENKDQNADGVKINYHNYTVFTSMLRVGIINNVELRFAADYLSQTASSNNIQIKNSGPTNLLAGAKYQFMKQELTGQDLGVIIQLYLPEGNKTLRPEHLEPEFLLAYGKDFSETVSLSSNIGGHWSSADNLLRFLYSASFGIKINDNCDSFLELYGDASNGSQLNYNIDGGFAYRFLNNLQFDISVGDELSSGSGNYFLSAGISFRLPN